MALLSNKVAVISGAGNGIGRAVAELFAQHDASLVLNDSGGDIAGIGSDPSVVERVAAGIVESGKLATAHHGDIATQSGVESLFRLTVEQYGKVDILVNCAGILRERALLNLQDNDIAAVLDVHVIGTFRLMQAAAKLMREQGGGRIVNTTSNNALLGNMSQCANSAAAAAIVGMTRSAAVELVRHRIFVNAVAPLAKTRQTEQLPLFQKSRGMTPEHAAPAYLFLASELAADTSGEVMNIAGNRLSRLVISESTGEFAESSDGRFGLDALTKAWGACST